ncbi:MAG: hypothetical protein J5382_09555 [Bacteroidales bacterium]|nr:hypothetical protein [Bacteroidales bacterium]
MEKKFNSINDIANYWKNQLESNSTAVNDYYREIYENGNLIGSAILYSTFKDKIANNLGMFSGKNMGLSKVVLVLQPDDGSVHICLSVYWNGQFWVIYPGQDNCEFNVMLYPKTYSPSQLANFVGGFVKKQFNLIKEYGTGNRVLGGYEVERGVWGFKSYHFENIPTPAQDLQRVVNQIEADLAKKRA